MNKLLVILLLVLCGGTAFSQKTLSRRDSIERTFTYQHGTISIRNGVGTITIPAGFKYLDATQAERVLTDIWHNPKSENMTLGFILPEKQGVMDSTGYVFNIQYDEIGYVKDDDANDINYDDLLTKMQEDAEEANKERQKEGYDAINIIGWASKPYYDDKRNILHWAKEIKFGTDSINTLNYNVRILGRKGVLILNAIATMRDLNAVKAGIPHVLNIVHFSDGYKYKDFDPGIDKVAAWTIGGLVAGKILAKVGFFALILKFWKLLAVAFVSVGSFIRKKLFGRKDEPASPPQPEPVGETQADTEPEAADESATDHAPESADEGSTDHAPNPNKENPPADEQDPDRK